MSINKIVLNLKVDIIISLLLVVLGFVARTVFIDSMGDELTGLMLLFSQLMAFLNLAELGVGVAAASILYKPLAEDDKESIFKTFIFLKSIYKKIAAFIIITGVVIGFILFFYVDNVSTVENAFVYWALVVVNTSLTYFFAHISTLFTADQNYHKTRKIQGGGKVIILSFQILLIYLLKSFTLYLLIETLGVLLQIIYLNYLAKKDYPYLFSDKFSDDCYNSSGSIKFDLTRKIKYMFFHKVGGIIVFNTDYILVSKFLSLSYVTIYASYMMIFQVVSLIMNILVNSITASVGKFLLTADSKSKLTFIKQMHVSFFALAAFLIYNLHYLINGFIINWIGEKFVLPNYIVILMLCNVFFSIVRIPSDIFKNASGIFRDIHFPILEGIINLTLSFVLIQQIGLAGVIIGTLISNVIIIMVFRPLYLYKRLFTPRNIVAFLIFDIYSKPLVLFSVALLLLLLLQHFVIPVNDFNHDWLTWIANALLSSGISAAIVILVFSLDTSFRKVIFRIVNIFK